jgi:hypothetical protein
VPAAGGRRGQKLPPPRPGRTGRAITGNPRLGRIGVDLLRCSGAGVVRNQAHRRPYKPKSNRATGSASVRLEFRQWHLLCCESWRVTGGAGSVSHLSGFSGGALARLRVPSPYKPNSGRAMTLPYQLRHGGSFTSCFRSLDRQPFGPGGGYLTVAAAASLSARRRAGTGVSPSTPAHSRALQLRELHSIRYNNTTSLSCYHNSDNDSPANSGTIPRRRPYLQ